MPTRERRPRLKTQREYNEEIVGKLDRIIGMEKLLMALTKKEAAELDALVQAIDDLFAGTAPIIAELESQVAALQAKDDVDVAEVKRLQELLNAAPSEQDITDAIDAVAAHVTSLGGTPTTTTTPAP